MKEANELRHALAQYHGCDQPLFNPLYRWMKYTDGVKCFAENAGGGAYWFLDILGTELRPFAEKERFLIITLTVYEDNSARIKAERDTDEPINWERRLEFTDCPQGTWMFYLVEDMLILPGEY